MCFDGYEGKGCRRTTCPNDCSGHGTCAYLRELRNDLGDGFKWTGNRPTSDQYQYQFGLLWDASKTRACICDPKWTDVDCSRRMCPKGNYALYAHTEPKPETQAIVLKNIFTPTTSNRDGAVGKRAVQQGDQGWNTDNGEFALTFRSTLNEEFTTKTLNVFNLTDEMVISALSDLPNKVIEDVEVNLYRNLSKATADAFTFGSVRLYPNIDGNAWYSTDLVILITYSGAMTTGDQFALECKTAYCGAGCQPMLTEPLDFKEGSSCTVINNYDTAFGVNIECSGRGSCDYGSGLCQCYEGYTDEYCSTQTALI